MEKVTLTAKLDTTGGYRIKWHEGQYWIVGHGVATACGTQYTSAKFVPGSLYSDILKGLCAHNGKDWHRGMYSQYFSSCWTIPSVYRYPGRYWVKREGGWWLTTLGYGLVGCP